MPGVGVVSHGGSSVNASSASASHTCSGWWRTGSNERHWKDEG